MHYRVVLTFLILFLLSLEVKVFPASDAPVAEDGEFQTLIQKVQTENLKLWDFVKGYEHQSLPVSEEKTAKQEPSASTLFNLEGSDIYAARHQRKIRNSGPTNTVSNSLAQSRRARRMSRKQSRNHNQESQGKSEIDNKHPGMRNGRPVKPLKIWNFELGVRNFANNSADGFEHDHEIFHKLSYRIRGQQRVFVEHKSIYFKGDGFGTFSRVGFGFQHFFRKFYDQPRWNPYIAALYDHWRGEMESYRGVPIVQKLDSKDIYTTRLGAEYALSDSSFLDFFIERGRNHLDFVDANGTTVELHARSNLYGLGILHHF